MLWADRLREVLRQRTDAFFSREGAALAGDDPGAIHDMRVASRRLQEVLRLVFSGAPRLPRLIRAIRRARRVQSGVRDLDAMAGRLQRMAKGAATDARAALRFVQKEVAVRRGRRHRKMAGALKALDMGRLRADLEGLTARLEKGPEAPEAFARGQVALRAQTQIAGHTDAFRKAVSTARGSLRPEDLHSARIAGKRLRYALEIADELQIGSFKKRIAQMRAIQQTLGHWHDLEVLEETVIDLFANRDAFRRQLPLVRAGCDLIPAWRAQKEAQVQEFLKLTEAFTAEIAETAEKRQKRRKGEMTKR